MLKSKDYKFWFATGSQDLYGDDCLKEVAEHSKKMVEGLNASGLLPFEDAHVFTCQNVDFRSAGV